MPMKIIDVVWRTVFVLAMPLFLLAAAFRIPANSAYFYEYLFAKYEVGATTGLDEAALGATAQGLVGYFNSSREYIDLTVIRNGQPFVLFNEREVVHLKDVRDLFQFDLRVLLVTAALVLSYACFCVVKARGARLARSALIGAGLTLVLIAAMGIGMLFDFDALLLQFHLFSFANDFWQLDPTRDYLIMLVTHGFMYDGAFIVAGATAVGALLIGGAASIYLLVTKRRTVKS